LRNLRLQSWLLVLFWALLIYGSSTSTFASPQTSRFFIPLMRFLLPGAAPATLDLLHEIARKSAHLIDYSMLGFLLFRALRAPHQGWALRWALWAVLIAGTYACSDEYHQSFEAGRGPSAMDALLDTTGATAAQVVTWLILKDRKQMAPADS
jgi:VanZ family protein